MKPYIIITLLTLATTLSSVSAGESRSATPVTEKTIPVRVASYNVEFGKSATPEQIGEMFKPYKLDIIE